MDKKTLERVLSGYGFVQSQIDHNIWIKTEDGTYDTTHWKVNLNLFEEEEPGLTYSEIGMNKKGSMIYRESTQFPRGSSTILDLLEESFGPLPSKQSYTREEVKELMVRAYSLGASNYDVREGNTYTVHASDPATMDFVESLIKNYY